MPPHRVLLLLQALQQLCYVSLCPKALIEPGLRELCLTPSFLPRGVESLQLRDHSLPLPAAALLLAFLVRHTRAQHAFVQLCEVKLVLIAGLVVGQPISLA